MGETIVEPSMFEILLTTLFPIAYLVLVTCLSIWVVKYLIRYGIDYYFKQKEEN